MNAEQVIKAVQDYSREYLEMVDNPDALVSGILASNTVKLLDYIEYLERRLSHYERMR